MLWEPCKKQQQWTNKRNLKSQYMDGRGDRTALIAFISYRHVSTQLKLIGSENCFQISINYIFEWIKNLRKIKMVFDWNKFPFSWVLFDEFGEISVKRANKQKRKRKKTFSLTVINNCKSDLKLNIYIVLFRSIEVFYFVYISEISTTEIEKKNEYPPLSFSIRVVLPLLFFLIFFIPVSKIHEHIWIKSK